MRITDLIAQSKDSYKVKQVVEIDHLIIGRDELCLSIYEHLKNSFPDKKINYLLNEKLEYQQLILKNPITLRGEENIALFKELLPEIELQVKSSSAKFYKDQKFRDFGSRSKPHEMLFDEKFFVSPTMEFDCRKIIGNQELIEEINNNRMAKLIDSIELMEDEKMSVVKTSDGSILKVQNLYWLDDPGSFFKIVKNKEIVSESFIEISSKLKPYHSLNIQFMYPKEVYNGRETLFIPHSMSSELGHFLVEFSSFNNEEKGQKISILSYMDENELAEEQIERKIRAIFSTLKRIFSINLQEKFDEIYSVNDQMPRLVFDKKLNPWSEKKLQGVFFVGSRAPFRDFWDEDLNSVYSKEVSGVTRSIASLHQLKKTLSEKNAE